MSIIRSIDEQTIKLQSVTPEIQFKGIHFQRNAQVFTKRRLILKIK
jgi:hypothetical protein